MVKESIDLVRQARTEWPDLACRHGCLTFGGRLARQTVPAADCLKTLEDSGRVSPALIKEMGDRLGAITAVAEMRAVLERFPVRA